MVDYKRGMYGLSSWLVVLIYGIIFVLYLYILFVKPWYYDLMMRFETWLLVFLLISVLYLVYEGLIIKNLSLLSDLEEKLENKNKDDIDLDRIDKKIACSIITFSSMVGVSFSLLVFLLGFFIISKKPFGMNVDTIIVVTSLTSLIIAGIHSLFGLNKYDTAACIIFTPKQKWEMRLSAKNYFLKSWYFLIFGVITALSLVDFSLTLLGYIVYTIFCNIYWEKSGKEILKISSEN